MRVAAVQCPAIADAPEEACGVIVEWLRWAEDEAVDLLLFPEAFLSGHSYDPATIRARAQAVSGQALSRLSDRVAGFHATLVVGAFERRGRQIFNSAFVIERGHCRGRYAKAYPNEPGVAAGTDFPTFDRSGVRYGINICNDANHADAAHRVAAAGASLILFPLNNMLAPATAARWRERSIANLVSRARQTACWIASADVTGRLGEHQSFGCTMIIDPDGRIVTRVPEMREGAAVYDVPLSSAPRSPAA